MSIVGDNIRKLRKLNGETQKQLAEKYFGEDSDSQHAISQYESGKVTPSYDFLEFIANRYNVSVESLRQVKLGFPEDVISWDALADSDNARLYQLMYPIFKTEKATENEDFTVAINQHVAFRKSICEVDIAGSQIVPIEIFDRYKKAANDGIWEAKANMISLVLMTYDIRISEHVVDDFTNKQLSAVQFANAYFDLILSQNRFEYRSEFINIVNEYFYDYLRDLKNSGKWSELADYYVWLLYKFCLFEKDIPATESMAIGDSLFRLAVRLKNKYVLRLGDKISPYISNQ